jgi:NAD(P)H-dependent FMN reductase
MEQLQKYCMKSPIIYLFLMIPILNTLTFVIWNFLFVKVAANANQLGKCVMDDDIEKLSNKIAGADGLIIGSPVYASNVSAQLKLLIDRGHFVIEQLLQYKTTFAIVTHENKGGSTALRVLKNLFLFSGSTYNINLRVKELFNTNPLLNEKLLRKLTKKSQYFYLAIKTEQKSFFRCIIHSIIFNIGIKPFILKYKSKYPGVLKRWAERGISYTI